VTAAGVLGGRGGADGRWTVVVVGRMVGSSSDSGWWMGWVDGQLDKGSEGGGGFRKERVKLKNGRRRSCGISMDSC
jgi:hypothetical protein